MLMFENHCPYLAEIFFPCSTKDFYSTPALKRNFDFMANLSRKNQTQNTLTTTTTTICIYCISKQL